MGRPPKGHGLSRLSTVGSLTAAAVLVAALGYFATEGDSSRGNFAPAPYVKSGMIATDQVLHQGQIRNVALSTAGFRRLLLLARAEFPAPLPDVSQLQAAAFVEARPYEPGGRSVFPQILPGWGGVLGTCRPTTQGPPPANEICLVESTNLDGLSKLQIRIVNNPDTPDSHGDESFTVSYFLSR
jgi:hypothetical protein